MQFKDFINTKTHTRRILIVSDISRGQSLIRLHEKQTGEMVCNVTCMTISQMVDSVYRYVLADAGFDEEYEFLDATSSMMLFRGVLLNNIKKMHYFTNDKLMDLATTYEIFGKVNLVRANGWSGKETKVNNDRVSDLKLLISEYEEKLSSEMKMDKVSKEKYVLEKLRSFADIKAELRLIFSADISYLAEDVNNLSGIEKDLLDVFINVDDPAVNAFGDGLTVAGLSNCSGKAKFYKGYGAFNEASYIANDIFEKKIPLGNVSVLYGSENQLPAITVALRGNGIPMNVLSNYSAKDNACISLAKRIIAWAKADFSEKELESVLSSPAICVQVEDGSGNVMNALAGQKYYKHILSARDRRDDGFVLGWGYERNSMFIQHEESITTETSIKEVLKMHSALLDIFGEAGKPYDEKNKVRPITVYEKLVAFIEQYTSNGDDYAAGIGEIKKITGAIRFEERQLSLDESLQFIDDLLSEIQTSDSSSSEAVSVQALQGWRTLDRSYVYVIGLSLKDMQGNTTESPVLNDDEMEAFLANGYVPTVKNEAIRRENNLLYTLSSFSGEEITFGYSNYDTVNFCENNASAFYREALEAFDGRKIKDLPEFVYGNPTGNVDLSALPTWKDKPSYDVRLVSSSSTLETLLDCPKKYAYEKLMNVPDNEFTECDYSQWLDAKNKGSFFHGILDKYCDTRMILKSTQAYEATVDEILVNEIAKDIEKEMLLKAPCAFEGLADRETDDIAKAASRYIQILLDELNSSSTWRVLEAEQKFIDAEYPVEGFDGKVYQFEFTGFIDRIDYCLDKTAKKCFLRIVDYKTGKKENKETEDELGKLMQYAIYEKAVMQSGKFEVEKKGTISLLDHIRDEIAELESDNSIYGYQYEFGCFQYVFPLDPLGEEPIEIFGAELERVNVVRLKAILDILEHKHVYPDHKELIEQVNNLLVDYPGNEDEINPLLNAISEIKKEAKNCKYCAYNYVCTNRKAGEI
ncbi:MAG: PD-(D/E)XK nuclease family protein [Butyrivibrio sp.]|nr:PD-(D/E)XK nuclease family protein [Butyrivibrio sp.]